MLNYTQKHLNFARNFTQKHPKFYNYVPVNKSGQKKRPPRLEKTYFALALGAPKSTAGGTCVAEEDERIAKGGHSDPKNAIAFFGERPYINTL